MSDAAARLRELSQQAELTPLERGELRGLRQQVGPAAAGSAQDRAVQLLLRGSLTPMQRGELRAIARGLPAEARRKVEAYLAAGYADEPPAS